MELNDSAKLFLNQMKSMHTKSGFPCCILDSEFEIIWYNDAALKIYPALTLPKGISVLLYDFNPQDIRDIIELEGHFCSSNTYGNLFSGHNFSIYLAPSECGKLYILQPNNFSDSGTGLHPKGLTRSITAFESHYRVPLATIFSALSIVKSKMPKENTSTPIILEYLSEVGKSTMNLLRTNQMVIDYTRLANGLYHDKTERIELFNYLADYFDSIAKEISVLDIQLDYEIPRKSALTVIGLSSLNSILCQLISNSCRFTRPENSITIKVSKNLYNIIIIISDRGLGIPAAVAPHIFEPYYAYSKGNVDSGNGLGLAIALECAAFLGGELTFTSCEGKGTSFRLSLPIRDDNSPTFLKSYEEDLDSLSEIRVLLSDCIPYDSF